MLAPSLYFCEIKYYCKDMKDNYSKTFSFYYDFKIS